MSNMKELLEKCHPLIVLLEAALASLTLITSLGIEDRTNMVLYLILAPVAIWSLAMGSKVTWWRAVTLGLWSLLHIGILLRVPLVGWLLGINSVLLYWLSYGLTVYASNKKASRNAREQIRRSMILGHAKLRNSEDILDILGNFRKFDGDGDGD